MIIIHNVPNYNSNSTGTTFENYSIKSTSPYHQLNSIGRQPNATPTPKPASPFQRVSGQFDASQTQQQPVKVILSNGKDTKDKVVSYAPPYSNQGFWIFECWEAKFSKISFADKFDEINTLLPQRYCSHEKAKTHAGIAVKELERSVMLIKQ